MGTKIGGGGTGVKIKSGVSGQRKSLTSGTKKRDISMLKARHKVAQKGDTKASEKVAVPRQQARNRVNV